MPTLEIRKKKAICFSKIHGSIFIFSSEYNKHKSPNMSLLMCYVQFIYLQAKKLLTYNHCN